MIQIQDGAKMGKVHMTDEGYLEVNALTARTGIQHYLGDEMGRPDMDVVSVYRGEDEVFSTDSLGTFSRIPVTVDHPEDMVDASNWKDLAVGTTGDGVLRDGEFLRIGLRITDKAAIKAIKSGKRELSVGYRSNIVWEDGVAPDGTPYQARQTNIKANHIAIVDAARAGSQARIGDASADNWGASPVNPGKERRMTLKTQTVVVDGLSVETTDAGAQAIAKLQKDAASAAKASETKIGKLEAKVADGAKAVEAKDAEIAVLKKKLTDSAITPKMLADAAASYAKVCDMAKKFGMKEEDMDEESEESIKKKVVGKEMGDAFVADISDEALDASWQALTRNVKKSDGERLSDGIRSKDPSTGFSDSAFDRAARSGLKLKKGAA